MAALAAKTPLIDAACDGGRPFKANEWRQWSDGITQSQADAALRLTKDDLAGISGNTRDLRHSRQPQSNAVSEIEIKMRYLEIWEESNGRALRRKWTYMYHTLRQNRNSKEATYQYDACKEAFFRLISSSPKMAQFCTDEKGHPFLYFSELTKRIIKTLKDNALSSIMPNWSESLHVLTWTRSLTFNLTPRSGHYS